MEYSRKFYNVPASSILESVIALCIISVCLYIAVIVFAAVFAPRTAAKYYGTQNRINEVFYLSQLKIDSLDNNDRELHVTEESVSGRLKMITVSYKDSTNNFSKNFYVQDGKNQ
ncbi:MAG TPA: hypothetical protein VGB50_11795 [Flavobacterium sp.]|jgi:hypothetical protein